MAANQPFELTVPSMTYDITRRDALVLGISAAALVTAGASAQTASTIKAADVAEPKLPIEKGASLRMLRPVRFVPADEEVFRANAAKFTAKTGVEVKVDLSDGKTSTSRPR